MPVFSQPDKIPGIQQRVLNCDGYTLHYLFAHTDTHAPLQDYTCINISDAALSLL